MKEHIKKNVRAIGPSRLKPAIHYGHFARTEYGST